MLKILLLRLQAHVAFSPQMMQLTVSSGLSTSHTDDRRSPPPLLTSSVPPKPHPPEHGDAGGRASLLVKASPDREPPHVTVMEITRNTNILVSHALR